jgi:hypothetical protein
MALDRMIAQSLRRAADLTSYEADPRRTAAKHARRGSYPNRHVPRFGPAKEAPPS